jgi:hypothetical protein
VQDGVGHQVCFEHHASREVQRVKVALLVDRDLDVGKQTRYSRAFAEGVHGRPGAAAQAGDHRQHRLTGQVLIELPLPV